MVINKLLWIQNLHSFSCYFVSTSNQLSVRTGRTRVVPGMARRATKLVCISCEICDCFLEIPSGYVKIAIENDH